MNIWFMLWVFIAVFVLGTSAWSYALLFRQRQAWSAFAKKHNLQFHSSSFLSSPMINGTYKGCNLAVYSDRQMVGQMVGKLHDSSAPVRTTFLFVLKAPMPTEGAIGSISFKSFIDGLGLTDSYVAEEGGLQKDVYNRLLKKEDLHSYVTPERITALNAIMTIKNNPALLIFSKDDTVLRIESPDPFVDAERLERFLSKASDAAKIISL